MSTKSRCILNMREQEKVNGIFKCWPGVNAPIMGVTSDMGGFLQGAAYRTESHHLQKSINFIIL